MNRQLIIGSVVGAVAVTALASVAGYRMVDSANYAEVVAVRPATKTVRVPREECRDELVSRTRDTKDPNQIAGTVAGAVVGGVLGNQVGGGDGKKLATVGGAVAGGYAGNKIQEGMQERNTYQESQRTCATVIDSREVPNGYDVTYRAEDREHVVHTNYDPGDRIAMADGKPVLKR